MASVELSAIFAFVEDSVVESAREIELAEVNPPSMRVFKAAREPATAWLPAMELAPAL